MNFCSKLASQTLLDEIQKHPNKNIVVSPLSFNAILNMIAAGTSGQTLTQMLKFLESTSIDNLNSQFAEFMDIAITENQLSKRENNNGNTKEGPLLCFVNGVWVDKLLNLKESYQKLVETVYNCDARNVDFEKVDEVLKEINGWAKSATKGLVTDVLRRDHIEPPPAIILGSALYFKGSWAGPFDREKTQDKYFYTLNMDKVKAPFMTGCTEYTYGSFNNMGKVKAPFMTGCTEYTYGSFDDFQVVKIPYQVGEDTKRQFSMYILLPRLYSGLQSLLQKVNSDDKFLSKLSHLQKREIREFWIPKFKFTYSNEEVLRTCQKLGLPKLDKVTDMVDSPNPLVVSKIIQKSFIEIDEKGTEGASATFAVLIMSCCSGYRPPPPIRFVADHPFMFMIREENSGLVFFTGAVLNPLEE